MSSEDELRNIVPNWAAQNLSWEEFGTCTQTDLDGLKNLWFRNDPIGCVKIQNVWVMHPLRKQGESSLQYVDYIIFVTLLFPKKKN